MTWNSRVLPACRFIPRIVRAISTRCTAVTAIPGNRTSTARVSSASGVLTMMEHSGTHLDALCHQANELRMFGGLAVDSEETPAGFKHLGVDTVPPLLRRGVLLDVCGHKGQSLLPSKYGITSDDLTSCAATQGVEVKTGDVLLVRTGYGALWGGDERVYLDAAGSEQIGHVMGCGQGSRGSGSGQHGLGCSRGTRSRNGSHALRPHLSAVGARHLHHGKSLSRRTARERRWEFVFVGVPLKFQGATGSPLRPLALV